MSSAPTYRPEIDGLRTIAVVAVILFHAELNIEGYLPFNGGYIGVDVFFVISGYLISLNILRDLRDDKFSLGRFYERRARRILPALSLVTAATLVFGAISLTPWRLEALARSALTAMVSLSNVYFWLHSGYFETSALDNPMLHTWTLGIEEQYYLIFPLVILALWRRARPLILPILLAGMVLSLASIYIVKSSDARFYLLPFRGWELAAGAITAWIEFRFGRPSLGLASSLTAIAGLAALLVSIALFDPDTPHPSVLTAIPVGGTALFIWAASQNNLMGRLLASTPFVATGVISYSLYLWHFPVFSLAHIHGGDETAFQKAGLICLILLLSIASFYFIERPFRDRSRVNGKALAISLIAATAAICALGGATILTDGFPQRYSPADRELVTFDSDALNDYVWARKDALHLAAFSGTQPKLLVIGDSFSGDLLNAFDETTLPENYSISSYTQYRGCGNVMVDQDISGLISPDRREICGQSLGYREPRLLTLIQQADVIILASSWLDWEVSLLPESIQNIKALSHAKIIVVGRKSFAPIDIDSLLTVDPERRVGMKNQVSEELIRQDSTLRRIIPGNEYIDLFDVLCGGYTCPLFDETGALISHDGGHVTPSGAKWMGRRLAAEAPIRGWPLAFGSTAPQLAGFQ